MNLLLFSHRGCDVLLVESICYSLVRAGFVTCVQVLLISRIICFWQLDVSDDDEADSLIKEAEGSDEEVENEDDDLLPF